MKIRHGKRSGSSKGHLPGPLWRPSVGSYLLEKSSLEGGRADNSGFAADSELAVVDSKLAVVGSGVTGVAVPVMPQGDGHS